MARLIALDVGEARIGVAVSDSTGFLASPYTTLHVSRNQSHQQLWEAIQRVIGETEAEGVIVGLPISLDGQIHAQAQKIQSFADRLQHHITIPLTLWDERLSTAEAQRLLSQRNLHPGESAGRWAVGAGEGGRRTGQTDRRRSRPKRQQRGQEIDALAAAVILQDYLDHRGITTEERQP